MKRTEPTIFKTQAWKRFEKEIGKPPKVRVTPITPSDKKQAKQVEKLMNYMFKTNANGITNKYMQVMRLSQQAFLKEELYGIRVKWEAVEKAVNQIAKEPKKYADMLANLSKE